MEWLMRLAFAETCASCDTPTWDFVWWVNWREHVQVYFNLPRCSGAKGGCGVAIDYLNSVGNKSGLCRACSQL